jgi:hypothetical protein
MAQPDHSRRRDTEKKMEMAGAYTAQTNIQNHKTRPHMEFSREKERRPTTKHLAPRQIFFP